MTTPYQARRAMRSRQLTLRGLSHHLLEWGQPGTEPPLVMLHGWMDVAASFQFVVDCFAQDRHVIAMDWRGFGLSADSGSDAYWFPDYLGDLDALLDAISPDTPVDLLGHSMGGNVVMSYAGVRPQRVRKLINLEGFGLPDVPAEKSPKLLARWLDELKTPQALRPYANLDEVAARLQKTNPRLPADKAAWLASHWSAATADGGRRILADAAHKRMNPVPYRRAEALACWAAITAPTLFVEGDGDHIAQFWGDRYPRQDFEERLKVVRQLSHRRLSEAGHMLHHDQPAALAREIEAFLAQG